MEGGPSDTDGDHHPHPSPLHGVQASPPAPGSDSPETDALSHLHCPPLPPEGLSSPCPQPGGGAAERSHSPRHGRAVEPWTNDFTSLCLNLH